MKSKHQKDFEKKVLSGKYFANSWLKYFAIYLSKVGKLPVSK